MLNNYRTWFNRRRPLLQLAICLVWYWIFVLIFNLIGEEIKFLEPRSWNYRLFHATWMSVFFTILFHGKVIVALFKGKNIPQSTTNTGK